MASLEDLIKDKKISPLEMMLLQLQLHGLVAVENKSDGMGQEVEKQKQLKRDIKDFISSESKYKNAYLDKCFSPEIIRDILENFSDKLDKNQQVFLRENYAKVCHAYGVPYPGADSILSSTKNKGESPSENTISNGKITNWKAIEESTEMPFHVDMMYQD